MGSIKELREKFEKDNKAVWQTALDAIPEPSLKNLKFAKLEDAKLAVVMIEFREHDWLKPVLFNACNIYGGREDVALVIVCGIKNNEFVKNIVDSWGDVRVVVLPYENIGIPQYNSLLTSVQFYELFDPCPSILLIQTDTVTRKAIPMEYLEYAYIGAPWYGPQINGPPRGVVGNGGYSLRDIKSMKRACRSHSYDPAKDTAEDLFFAKYASSPVGKQIAPPDVAAKFSVEHIPSDDPCGMHQAWRFHASETLIRWLECIKTN